MEYLVKLDKDAEWGRFDPWFDSFVDLGFKLYNARKMGHVYKKVAIGVPKSPFVALAMAIGFSRAAYKEGTDFSKEVSLDDVKVGEVIAFRGAWSQPEPGVSRLPRSSVGLVSAIKSGSGNLTEIHFTFDTGAVAEKRNFNKALSADDRTKLPRLFSVPLGTPQRPEQTRKSREVVDDSPRTRENKEFFESWDYQICPTLVIFGPTGRLDDYKKPLVRDEEIHGKLMIESDSLFNLARLDRLSNDVNPHFVNAVEQISQFPTNGSPAFESLKRFPFVCLDGNDAILNLSEKRIFQDKTLIALWEATGNQHQDVALRTFAKAASQNTPVPDFAGALGWTPPAGVQIWGWR